MRYAIISDIHSNLQALKAVLTDIRSNNIDEIICLGDVVGYGPSPEKTVELAYNSIHYFVLGNHDAVLSGFISSGNFNDDAKNIIEWTKHRLSDAVTEFFKSLPLMLDAEQFICVHSDIVKPELFNYIIDTESALSTFNCTDKQIIFTGHTHIPGIFVQGRSKNAHWLEPTDFGLEEHKKYIINVGSVGQPRNGDIRASYCIIDTVQKNIFFRAVPFDIDRYKKELEKNSISAAASYFLFSDKKGPVPPLREQIQFTPLQQSDNSSKNMPVKIQTLEETISRLKKTHKKYKIITSLLVILLACLLTLYMRFYNKSARVAQPLLIRPLHSRIVKYRHFTGKDNLLYPPEAPKHKKYPKKTIASSGNKNSHLSDLSGSSQIISTKSPQNYWFVKMYAPDSQKITVEIPQLSNTNKPNQYGKTKKLPVINIFSEKEQDIYFYHTGIFFPKKMRVQASLQYKANIKSGYFELIVKERKPDGKLIILVRSRAVSEVYEKKWKKLSVTTPVGREVQKNSVVFYTIHSRSLGKIRIRKMKLTVKK